MSQIGNQSLCSNISFFLFGQVVSDAAGNGVTITGTKTFNNWNWPNAVIFAATVITTIGAFSSTRNSTMSKCNDRNSCNNSSNSNTSIYYSNNSYSSVSCGSKGYSSSKSNSININCNIRYSNSNSSKNYCSCSSKNMTKAAPKLKI